MVQLWLSQVKYANRAAVMCFELRTLFETPDSYQEFAPCPVANT